MNFISCCLLGLMVSNACLPPVPRQVTAGLGDRGTLICRVAQSTSLPSSLAETWLRECSACTERAHMNTDPALRALPHTENYESEAAREGKVSPVLAVNMAASIHPRLAKCKGGKWKKIQVHNWCVLCCPLI